MSVEQYKPINRYVGNMVDIKEYPTHVRPGDVPNAYNIDTQEEAGELCECYEHDPGQSLATALSLSVPSAGTSLNGICGNRTPGASDQQPKLNRKTANLL